MLLHDLKSNDSIKSFFTAVHENYIKILMNPFYEPNTPITEQPFHEKVKQLGVQYLKIK